MADLGSLVAAGASLVADSLFENARSGEAIYQNTRVVVSFHTDDGYDGAIDSGLIDAGGIASLASTAGGAVGLAVGGVIDAASKSDEPQPMRIFGLTTHKAFGGNPGTWSLQVKGRGDTDVMRLWPDPEDVWVRIVILKNGIPTEVMFGLMNTVTENLTRGQSGERNLTYTLQGVDFHKVLSSTQLYINIHENAGQLPIIPLYSAVAENINGRPDEIIDTVICAWLGNNGVADKQWQLPKSLGGGYFFDLLRRDFQETRGQTYDPSLYSPDQMMGKSLWTTLEEYSNGLLNELYTTMFEDGPFDPNFQPLPELVLRERPFPSKDKGIRSWEDLKTHILNPGDMKGRQITRGAPESRFNYWLLDARGLVGDGLAVQLQIQQQANREKGVPGSAPIYNIEDIRRHGFRKFMQSTRFFPFRDNPSWFTHAARWIQLLHDWYAVAPYELNGTLNASAVFPEIRLGQRVRERRKTGVDVTYYVEGVTHAWTYPGPGVTTLNVTRGEFADEELLDMVYSKVVFPLGFEGMLDAAVGLSDAANFGSHVPTGSGPQLDRQVGQVDSPERLFLKDRGITVNDQERIRRGEPQTLREGNIRTLRPADLPDQQVSEEDEILVGNAKPRPRKQGGNLTQRELEAGVPLPVREENLGQTEPAKETADQARARWAKTAGRRKSGRR